MVDFGFRRYRHGGGFAHRLHRVVKILCLESQGQLVDVNGDRDDQPRTGFNQLEPASKQAFRLSDIPLQFTGQRRESLSNFELQSDSGRSGARGSGNPTMLDVILRDFLEL